MELLDNTVDLQIRTVYDKVHRTLRHTPGASEDVYRLFADLLLFSLRVLIFSQDAE